MAQRRVADYPRVAAPAIGLPIPVVPRADMEIAPRIADARCHECGKRDLLHRFPARGLRGAEMRAMQTAPRRLDVGVGGALASRPRLGGRRRIFGDVIADGGAGGAMTGVFGGLRGGGQAKADRGNA